MSNPFTVVAVPVGDLDNSLNVAARRGLHVHAILPLRYALHRPPRIPSTPEELNSDGAMNLAEVIVVYGAQKP